MNAIDNKWKEKLGVASFLAMGVVLVWGIDGVSAQITPDNTMGGENSRVTSTGEVDAIDGGATRGANLFHSFREFNVDEGRTAVFTNPAGIENILTRVTGTNPSNILGVLGVAGNANLFLLNPNGIIFGANARLDVGGSFVATTANGIGFGDRGDFSATNPQNVSSLLNVNPNALLFNQIRAASIQNNSVAPSGLNPSAAFTARGLRVRDGNSLLLVGGEIDIDGGGLYAFGGRVELGGLSGAGTVGLTGDGNNLSLSFPTSVERSDVYLSSSARVNVIAGDGGSIAVHARNFAMTGESFLYAGIESRLGSEQSQAGNIEINATGAINLDRMSSVANTVESEARGQGGDVSVSASSLQLKGGAQINATTFGAGKSGNLIVNASEVQLNGIGTTADAQISSGLFSSAQPDSTGDTGNTSIKTNRLVVQDGAQVFSGTLGTGNGGDLTVDAAQDIELSGRSPDGTLPSALSSSAEQNFRGKAGNVIIRTKKLSVRDGAQVFSGTFGKGRGGDITVNATQEVQLIGGGQSKDDWFPSSVLTDTRENSTGDAGDLTIHTPVLQLRDGAQVRTETRGQGRGGRLTVNTRDLQAIGKDKVTQFPSGLSASATSTSTGDAGDVIINTVIFSVQGGAKVGVQSLGTGTAGNMIINARSTRLDDNALLTADTRSTKFAPDSEQATITINSQSLFMSRNSNIFTNAEGENVSGGNIKIDTNFLFALENSDIRADSDNFRGGNVRIDAFGIFGTQFREVPSTRTSDITASGSTPERNGSVELDVPDIDLNNGLVNPPSVPVDTQIANNCTPSQNQNQSKFIMTGRGGLPPSPTGILSSDATSIDWVALSPTIADRSSPTPLSNSTAPSPAPITEAQGWEIDRQGKVILTASTASVPAHNSWHSSAECKLPSTTKKQ